MLLLVQAHIAADDLGPVPELLRKSESNYIANYGTDHRKLSFLELVTGQYRLATGDVEGAREILRAAYDHRLEEYDPDNVLVLSPLFTLVSLELRAGDTAQAREWLEETRPAVKLLKTRHPEHIEANILEAEVLVAEGQRDEARAMGARTLKLLDEHFPNREDWRRRLAAL